MSPVLRQVLVGLGSASVATLALFGARALALRLLARDRNDPTSFRDLVIRVTRTPSVFWCLALGLLVGVSFSPLPDRYEGTCRTLIRVIVMISVIIVTSNLGEGLIRRWLNRHGSPMSSSGLIKGVVRTVVYGIGSLVVLQDLGVRIGPLLTALGVGGLAAALAFKDTAENLFSGIHLLVDRSVEVGDLIKLEAGQEGTVRDIGWRTSKIALKDNDDYILIIPNTKLAQNIMIRKGKREPQGNQGSTLYKRLAS